MRSVRWSSGAGDKAFSSGYDITAIPTRVSPVLERPVGQKKPFDLALDSIINFPYPVIAMLNGYAFGGACDLAVACDLRIAADDIQMGMVPARLGWSIFRTGSSASSAPSAGHNTKEMFFTARRYKAERLKAMGLVNYLVPREELESLHLRPGRGNSRNAPLALKGMKERS